jgi:hypothetical protein
MAILERKESDRPLILAGFGDQWPSLESGDVKLSRGSNLPNLQPVRFHTPRRLEANYSLANKPLLKSYDIAHVGATVLGLAGLECGNGFSSNLWLRDRLNGAYVESNDQSLVKGCLTNAHDSLGAWR